MILISKTISISLAFRFGVWLVIFEPVFYYRKKEKVFGPNRLMIKTRECTLIWHFLGPSPCPTNYNPDLNGCRNASGVKFWMASV
jgi:hypothetical protein